MNESCPKVKIQPDWLCNLGESVKHLKVNTSRNGDNEVVAVAEQTFFVITSRGKIKY